MLINYNSENRYKTSIHTSEIAIHSVSIINSVTIFQLFCFYDTTNMSITMKNPVTIPKEYFSSAYSLSVYYFITPSLLKLTSGLIMWWFFVLIAYLILIRKSLQWHELTQSVIFVNCCIASDISGCKWFNMYSSDPMPLQKCEWIFLSNFWLLYIVQKIPIYGAPGVSQTSSCFVLLVKCFFILLFKYSCNNLNI